MKVNAIKCPDCKDIVYSRSRHDFRWCSCQAVAIDGGLDYMKITFTNQLPERLEIEVDATKNDLFEDWSTKADKHGIIKEKKKKKSRKT